MITSIPPVLVAMLAAGTGHHAFGLITSADLRDVAISRARLATLLDRGLLTALARGVYSPTQLLVRLDDWARLAIRTAALLHAGPDDAVAAGWSAIAFADLPHLGRAPSKPDVIRRATPPRGSDMTSRARTRFATVPPEWIVESGTYATVHPAIAVADISRRTSQLSALVIADAVARFHGGRETLAAAIRTMRHWPGSARARWPVANADPDCETPLETIGRFAVLRAGLPRPVSNVWVGTDMPRYRLDHYWDEYRLALEGDGIFKYRLRGGAAAAIDDALVAEKEREFELRDLGIRTERYGWRRALREPNSVALRCRAAIADEPLPGHSNLRVWPAKEGCELLGIEHPDPVDEPGWRTQVSSAIAALRTPPLCVSPVS